MWKDGLKCFEDMLIGNFLTSSERQKEIFLDTSMVNALSNGKETLDAQVNSHEFEQNSVKDEI